MMTAKRQRTYQYGHPPSGLQVPYDTCSCSLHRRHLIQVLSDSGSGMGAARGCQLRSEAVTAPGCADAGPGMANGIPAEATSAITSNTTRGNLTTPRPCMRLRVPPTFFFMVSPPTCRAARLDRLSTAFGKSGWAVLVSPGWRPSVFQAGGRLFSPGGGVRSPAGSPPCRRGPRRAGGSRPWPGRGGRGGAAGRRWRWRGFSA